MSRPSAPDLADRIAGLSPAKRELLERKLRGRGTEALRAESIPRRTEPGTAPLSFAQQRLWFLDQLEPGGSTYNVPRAFRVKGAIRVDALRRSLDEIFDRHEVLRTRFETVAEEPTQVVSERGAAPFEMVDLTSLPENEREAAAMRVVHAEERASFDLGAGEMVRTRLLRLSPEDHVFLWTNHHIVSDAWSAAILLRELSVLYNAFASGGGSPLPPLSIQYADFAAWQRGESHAPALAGELAYWKSRLADLPDDIELPEEPRVIPSGAAPASLEALTLSEKTARLLRAFAQWESVTVFMVALAALKALLHRYSGSEDILVGSPIAGRTRTELEELIGCFVNTLVFRTDLSGDPTFRELLARVKEVALEAYSHQDAPFERLVEEIAPKRVLGRSPLVRVLFVHQTAPVHPLDWTGLAVTPIAPTLATGKFDLTVAITGGESPMRVSAEYRADLFRPEAVQRLLRNFVTLLESGLRDPDRRLSDLDLLSPEELRILSEWNATGREYGEPGYIPDIFERRAQETPDRIALEFEGETFTYEALNRRSNQLAHVLLANGVRHGDLVPIVAERSVEMVAGLLAVLKSGAAYVPIDPDHPRERAEVILEDTSAAVVLVQDGLFDRVPHADGRTVLSLFAADESDGRSNPVRKIGGESAAYVIYTSGSTGKPKGVVNTHAGIRNRLLWMQDEYRLTADDRVLQKTPYTFDVSVWEFFWPLLVGARLVVARPGGHRDPDYLMRTISERQVTTLHFVPSMLNAMLEGPPSRERIALRLVFCSGEALSPELVRRFFARFESPLHNLYGPTEAAVDVTYFECAPEMPLRTVPIGRPIANTKIEILDTHGKRAPIGAAGEIHIGGIGVARGYLNQPDLTSRNFVTDPFEPVSGARLYRTGDRGRWLSDGNIEFLGRLDDQVKVRGFRVEPGEIESVLRQHPRVRDCVVQLRDEALVAYVVENPGTGERSEVRSLLKTKLPEFMVPSAFVWLERFPVNASGKIDRNALRALSLESAEQRPSLVEPRTPLESSLLALWCEVLGRETVSIEDSFFDLGGHSLLATKLISRLRDAFRLDLPLRDLFLHPTVAQMALAIAQRQAEGIAPAEMDRILAELEGSGGEGSSR